MVRGAGCVLGALIFLLAATAAGGASAGDGQLIYMQQVRPVTITPQSISVRADGEAAEIVVLGESAIPRPIRFRLGNDSLAHLRALIERSGIAHLHLNAPIPFRRLMYTVRAAGNAVRVVQGHVPPSLQPLIAFLHALIAAHE